MLAVADLVMSRCIYDRRPRSDTKARLRCRALRRVFYQRYNGSQIERGEHYRVCYDGYLIDSHRYRYIGKFFQKRNRSCVFSSDAFSDRRFDSFRRARWEKEKTATRSETQKTYKKKLTGVSVTEYNVVSTNQRIYKGKRK